MIFLFTDFGLEGPYVGQVKAVIARQAPRTRVIDLFADAPAFDSQLSAYLLAAYAPVAETGDVLLCVIDPGVGSERAPVVVKADGRWLVGPDNGLFEVMARRASDVESWRIDWRPDRLSSSFHGRDLFAPAAAWLACGTAVEMTPFELVRCPDWPDELDRIVYIDRYGNAMTGRRAASLPTGAALVVGDQRLERAGTFSSVSPGQAFWYGNANGLVEIAVNRGSAAKALGLGIGDPVGIVSGRF